MDSNDSITSLTDRKVVRRGLLAGLASLGGAALLKVAGGAKHVEAAPIAMLIPGASGDGVAVNTSYNITNLLAGAPFNSSFMFQVNAAAGAGPVIDGIYGYAKGPNGWGVTGFGGSGASSTSYGVRGEGGLGTGSFAGSPGVHGIGGNGVGTGNGGTGVQGLAGTGVNGISGFGVQGTSGNRTGVLGQSTSGDGVHGTSTFGVGLRGTSPNFVGVVGISDQSIGLYGYNAAPNVPALYAENLAANPANRFAAQFNGDVWVHGNFVVVGGGKYAAVPMPDGTEALVYCQESPEPYFEDFGRARLVNGVAHVQLEPEFASIVKRDDYMVYLTPEGETKGHLFIGPKNANGFDVREAGGGTSNVPFTYRIVAKRKDIEGKRLARLDPQAKNHIAKMRADAAQKSAATTFRPGGEGPLVPREDPVPFPPQAAMKPQQP